jgi:hypothetical protein
MNRFFMFVPPAAVAAAALVVAGCSNDDVAPALPVTVPTPAAAPAPPAAEAEHGHKPSAHGGTVVAIGRDSYHAEAVFEKGGRLRLYTLGRDEARVQEVEARPLTAFAKSAGDTEAAEFTLAPEPQPGDAPGQTSRFTGPLPAGLAGKPVEVTVPNLAIGGERFRVSFASAAAEPTAGHDLPAKVTDDAERRLYLTPGGRYTAADIRANGAVTASEKFRGIMASHDMKPRPGDKLCPVTMTKANPKFSWVVGGAVYEFCCPPCVDEFVQTAKERPDEVLPPEEYRKK